MVDQSPKTVTELAHATGASTRGLRAILNALVELELLTQSGDWYSPTPESATFLVSTGTRGHVHFCGNQSMVERSRFQLAAQSRSARPFTVDFGQQTVTDVIRLEVAPATQGFLANLRENQSAFPHQNAS